MILGNSPDKASIDGLLERLTETRDLLRRGNTETGQACLRACRMLYDLWLRAYGTNFPGLLAVEAAFGETERLLNEQKERQP